VYVLDNPVLQRELLVNLRTKRAFLLLLGYQVLLAAVVVFAWPQETRLDLSGKPEQAQRLVNLFFLGQYLLASLMAPSFAAAAITGEKERKTYESLLASPLRPSAIVIGKLFASLAHLAVLIFSSLPIVMLCIPLGGVSIYELLTAYLALIMSVTAFGMISIACSSFFQRTSSSLVVSYLLILPFALIGVLFWQATAGAGAYRLGVTLTVLPALCGAIVVSLFVQTARRLTHPPDLGSEGKEVVDLDQEAQQAVGLVIQPDQFPDKLFAPAPRKDLLPDGANPVYSKEIHSEIFSHGTLMVRLVIQVSILLALPIMAVCLYIKPEYAAWYISYVVFFNLLVGPVYSASTVTSERERQTLDLLLTTTLTPWQILWGKLVAGLRISSVLTLFLLWPLVLAVPLVDHYWARLPAVGLFVLIVLLTCLTTAIVAMFFSLIFRKATTSLMNSYLVLATLFIAPLAVGYFSETFFPQSQARDDLQWLRVTSPIAAAFDIPFQPTKASRARRSWDQEDAPAASSSQSVWLRPCVFAGLTVLVNIGLLVAMIWLFHMRWRVS